MTENLLDIRGLDGAREVHTGLPWREFQATHQRDIFGFVHVPVGGRHGEKGSEKAEALSLREHAKVENFGNGRHGKRGVEETRI